MKALISTTEYGIQSNPHSNHTHHTYVCEPSGVVCGVKSFDLTVNASHGSIRICKGYVENLQFQVVKSPRLLFWPDELTGLMNAVQWGGLGCNEGRRFT